MAKRKADDLVLPLGASDPFAGLLRVQTTHADGTVDESRSTCLYDVVYPPVADSSGSAAGAAECPAPIQAPGRRHGPPAREYPFALDAFQQTAINCLERGESVLVSAHTSAGKTVVAEYAIAMALRDKQRVVYTSPLKALSNQKYRALAETFAGVGLLTGDVNLNPDASCLVMTTEILRSMLYRSAEVVREVRWVIMDEIHYLRDPERGVVWEEAIALAPPGVRFVFLSATIPNARQFAGWVAAVHRQPCHVVYTDFRPTPLQHYIFPAGGDGIFLVVDEQSRFREDNFAKALAALTPAAAAGDTKKAAGDKDGPPSDMYKLVKMVMARQLDPCIVFAFSKREVEALALQMSRLDLASSAEARSIEAVFGNALDTLAEEDRRLPQVAALLPLLRRGIGVHHSGLLPLLKARRIDCP